KLVRGYAGAPLPGAHRLAGRAREFLVFCCMSNTGVVLLNTYLLTQCSIVRSIRRIQSGCTMVRVVVGRPLGIATAIAIPIGLVDLLLSTALSGVKCALFRMPGD